MKSVNGVIIKPPSHIYAWYKSIISEGFYLSRSMLNLVISIVLSATLCIDSAYAYLDPGTGGLIIQFLAIVFGTLIFYSKKIIRFLRRKKGDSQNTEQKKDE